MAEQITTIGPTVDPVRMMMLKHIVGFLTPVYSEHLENGRTMHAFADRDDFQRIQDGYACGDCLSAFDTYMEVCPACGLARRDAARVDKTPEEWDQFHQEHLHGGVTGRANTADEAFRRVAADRDIDQAKLSSLRPNSAARKHRHG